MNSIRDKVFFLFNRPKFFMAHIKTQFFYKFFFGCIGRGTIILSPEFISNPSYIELGENVIIHPNARILCVKEFKGKSFHPSIKIGNNVKIQQGVHIACAGKILIEDGVTIGQYVRIFDIDHTYHDTSKPIHSQPIYAGKVIIGKNSFIGTGSVIMSGAKIGKNCIVGANAVVKGHFADQIVLGGIPAKVIKNIKPK